MPKKLRCKYCNSKLKIISFDCECSNGKKIFCTKCRLPENHKCNIDYTSEKQKQNLKESLIEVKYEKVIQI